VFSLTLCPSRTPVGCLRHRPTEKQTSPGAVSRERDSVDATLPEKKVLSFHGVKKEWGIFNLISVRFPCVWHDRKKFSVRRTDYKIRMWVLKKRAELGQDSFSNA
jgi:hypothetical protein